MTASLPVQSGAQPLIVAGRPRFGRFDASLARINHRDFRLRTPFGRPAGALSSWLGFKEFQYFGGMSPQLVFGCALAHLRHTAIGFVYVYDVEARELFTHTLRSPLGLGLALADNPVEGESRIRQGQASMAMRYQATPREKSLAVSVGHSLQIEAVMAEPDFEPMSLCTRTGYSGWAYTNKTAGLPLIGSLRFRDRVFDLGALGAMGSHDFTCGFLRRETFWNWACFSGTSGGHRLGLNLSCGVNETSGSENCLWVDGRLIKVDFARFDFDPDDILRPWRLDSEDGQVALRFTPLGMHRERLNAGLVASHFRQLFGHFEGEFRVEGTSIPVHGVTGFMEDHFARW